MPASNSSGVSITIAGGGGSCACASSRKAMTTAATRGHSTPSSHLRSSGAANTRAATAARSTTSPGATSAPQRSTSSARTSPAWCSSCTTASVDSVAAPSRASAASAVDLPAAMPPVSPTNGTRAALRRLRLLCRVLGGGVRLRLGLSLGGRGAIALGRGRLLDRGRLVDRRGLLDRGGLLDRRARLRLGGGLRLLGRRALTAGEDVLREAELRHVVEAGAVGLVAGRLVLRGLRLAQRQHLALDALDRERQAAA